MTKHLAPHPGRNTSSRLLRRGYGGQPQQRSAPAPRPRNSSKSLENGSDRLRDHEYAKMESASKRKAGNAALSPGEGRPAKRQKAPVRAPLIGARQDWLHRGRRVERCTRRLARCGMRSWTWARHSRLGRPTGSTAHHRAAAARTPDTAAMQPKMEHIPHADNGECFADHAFCAYRVLEERLPNQQRRWA